MSNKSGITTKDECNYQMGLASFWWRPTFKFCFIWKQREQNVTVEMNAPQVQNGNTGANVAMKARFIYPNLKLRVYTTGMRQNRLAKLVGIDEAYLSRIINGVRVPGKQMQEQIAQVLGCDADWLFQQTPVQTPLEFNGNGAKIG